MWIVLHPAPEDRFPRADDRVLVLLGLHGETRLLLLSDLGAAGQNALVQRNPGLAADIVVAGLPDQGEPLADGLIDALQPRVIVITDSEYPASARASESLRERLGRRKIPVLYTRDTGAVTVTLKQKGWVITAMDGTRIESATTRR